MRNFPDDFPAMSGRQDFYEEQRLDLKLILKLKEVYYEKNIRNFNICF